MSVPASVKLLLDNQKVDYNLADTPSDEQQSHVWHDHHLRTIGAAKSLILQDKVGRVQVVMPADTLLDLNALNRLLSRELRATTPAELEKFFTKHHLQSIPALPKLAGLPTVVDEALLKKSALLLDSGSSQQLIQLRQQDFKNLLADAITASVTIPLQELEQEDDGPSDEEQINRSIKQFTQLRIKQRLEETLELPPLPETAQRIIKLRVDPDADISDLANVVETDPSLAAQVVSWAASPYYSAPGKIKSIHDAIVRVLGFDMVLNLALGIALGKTMSMPKDGPNGMMPYWQEAVYMAATIEGLVTAIPRDHRPGFGMAYLSGLLHNFGLLILAEIFPPHFGSICRHMEANPHVSHQAIEKHLLQINREQLSSTLMGLWNMPDEVVVALRHQNNPLFDGEHHEYAKLIYVAKRMLSQRNKSLGPKTDVPADVFAALHLDPVKAQMTVDNILDLSLIHI